MNWKLTQKCIDDPQVEDWSDWKIMEPAQMLDDIYSQLKAQGRADGVVKIRSGVYLAAGGSWNT